jgi:hypothetical protein
MEAENVSKFKSTERKKQLEPHLSDIKPISPEDPTAVPMQFGPLLAKLAQARKNRAQRERNILEDNSVLNASLGLKQIMKPLFRTTDVYD